MSRNNFTVRELREENSRLRPLYYVPLSPEELRFLWRILSFYEPDNFQDYRVLSDLKSFLFERYMRYEKR